MRPLCALLTLALAATAVAAQAGDGQPDIFAAAKSAVIRNNLDKTHAVGFSIVKTPFSEAPLDGGILIGFDVGVGKAGKEEFVYTLRAVFLGPDGEFKSSDFGIFYDKQLGKGKVLKTRISRVVRLRAKDGYAVGAITVKQRIGVTGLQLTYQKIKGVGLDPDDSYTSDWVGDPAKGGNTVDSKGNLVVGVHGNMDDDAVLALGLTFMKPGAAAKSPPAKAPKNPPPAKEPQETAKAPPDTLRPGDQTGRPPQVVVQPEKPAPKPAEPAAAPPAKAAPAPQPVAAFPAKALPGGDDDDDDDPLDPEDDICPEDGKPASGSSAGGVDIRGAVILGLIFVVLVGGTGALVVARHTGMFQRTMPRLPPATVLPARSVSPPPLPGSSAAVSKQPQTAAAAEAWDQGWGAPAKQNAQPTFFLGRVRLGMGDYRHCRVYVLPRELLFLHMGQDPNRTAMTGFAVGGLVGGAVGAVIAHSQRNQQNARLHDLDAADTADLVRRAGEERDSFGMALDDVLGASFEGLSFWQRMFNSACVAHLHLVHRESGKVTVELQKEIEARTALEQLTPLLGDRLAIRATWDEYYRRYVPRRG
jgi:hypothetical protein